ncbi:Nramp family divalent metal transporter [Erythrobacter sp. THAF29]|uniref:Nramp family divalent metal transporter n=1 Tax=Erythrobacter sp. THAF29 TaxID=2587851 RepID=UPI0012694A84|nr:Nramp family divalent metal transporter [Erythrobacter sp. THAF29]QFT78483.1 Divalent metal cation transporter MntH [Erythrobacter sp. THAF29]
MNERLRNVGPGALVAAAFIGPGTVTACTVAGASHGFALVWALVFATFATIVLQEMAARLGVVAQKGLGETLAGLLDATIWKWPLILLVGLALYLGNAAYEAGNLSGAALGIQALAGETDGVFAGSVAAIAVLAGALLLSGSYRLIERVLIGLVVVMAMAFVATFAIVRPDIGALVAGAVTPVVPEGALLTVIALIGTTVVPYNLFLHSTAAKTKWQGEEDLGAMRADTAVAIGLGGLIAILILSTSAASLFAAGIEVSSAAEMAGQFEPLFGPYSKYLLAIGLFAAGLTSAITAPLATGFAMTEILKLESRQTSRGFRLIALSVIVIGAALALTGTRPIEIIVLAQFANGLLLPIIAAFLLYAVNRPELLGRHANGTLANVLGIGVVLVAAGLGLRLIVTAIA